ncbi:hypothetical protein, partial [Acinetobacter baumannii]|uniref:hypothetical protein n=1 Tax=Acinetobacter baumannii TaxID=470 RepID=UPI0013D44081
HEHGLALPLRQTVAVGVFDFRDAGKDILHRRRRTPAIETFPESALDLSFHMVTGAGLKTPHIVTDYFAPFD